jgi:hypothetical protein
MKNKIDIKVTNMNQKKTTSKKQTRLIAMAIIAASTIAIVIVGITNIQSLQKAIAQEINPLVTSTTMNNNTPLTNPINATVKAVSPNQSTNKEFWINTVHFDGMTNVRAATKCDTCSQNMPLHPAERFPNATHPSGRGFVLISPNKAGAWDFRSFAFAPSQIVVNQGDRVTIHFIGVQGFHHVITVEGVETFPLERAQIHTVSFVANNPGTIGYYCHIHIPNMVGQILVLQKLK